MYFAVVRRVAGGFHSMDVNMLLSVGLEKTWRTIKISFICHCHQGIGIFFVKSSC